MLPTPAGLADVVGPLLDLVRVRRRLARPSWPLVATVAVAVLVLAGRRGPARGDRSRSSSSAIVATDEDVTDRDRRCRAGAGRHGRARRRRRILAARLVAMLPFVVALAFGTATIVAATYRELTLPGDAATPIVWRVLRSVPLTRCCSCSSTWLLGEIVGGLAARRIVLDGGRRAAGSGDAVSDAVRRPVRTVVVFAVPSVGLLLAVVPSVAAASAAWHAVQVGAVHRGPAGDGHRGHGLRGALGRRASSSPAWPAPGDTRPGPSTRVPVADAIGRPIGHDPNGGLEPAPDVWHAIGPPSARGGCRGER